MRPLTIAYPAALHFPVKSRILTGIAAIRLTCQKSWNQKLPGEGVALVCTKQDFSPDGSQFVGFGITPDVEAIPFQTIDWTSIPRIEHKGERGIAYWQTM